MHIPPPGVEMGQLANKLGWKEKWMDSGSLVTITNSHKIHRVVVMIGIEKGAAGRGIARIKWLKRDRELIENPSGKLLRVSRLTAKFKEKINLIPG
jgi:hypothetical protein